jgi:branched-chain amino acid transport system permease protein
MDYKENGSMANVRRKKQLLMGIGVCLLLLFAPFLLKGYWVRLLTNIFMFAVLAESVNIIAGYCGYLSLGNMLFFGIGAYVEAVLMARFGFSFYTALSLAGLEEHRGLCFLFFQGMRLPPIFSFTILCSV